MIKSRKQSQIDRKEYLNNQFEIQPDFERFNQENDIFSRALWDDKIDPKAFFKSYDITNFKPKKAQGFDHWDFAFRNASWHITDFIGERNLETEHTVEGFTDYYSLHSQGPVSKIKLHSKKDTTKRIKLAAEKFGAGMVGICKRDDRWIYSHQFNRVTQNSQPLEIPDSLKYVIMLIIPMDYELSKTYPSGLSGASTGLGYTTGLACANTLAQFITNLGYNAIASLNDTALNIPMAIEAGLGEYGRHGLLITPKFGPNIRIAKVFTNLPLHLDQPVEFGVKKFCNICQRCSKNCPAKAIPTGPPSDTPPNFSSHSKIKKWTINAEKCFKLWVGINTDCAICIRVCPYNKNFSKWWHRIGIKMANSPFRRFVLVLDDIFKFGFRKSPNKWWSSYGKP